MASNPLRKSGRDINFLCGAATGEPVFLHTVLPSFNAIHTNIPERRGVGNPLPPWQPQDLSLPLRPPNRSPSSHHSPIQLPPLSNQRFSAPDMRRHRTDWGPNRNNTVADYTHDPFSAPDMRDQLSSSPLSASARDYYRHMGKGPRHFYHNGMMSRCHSRQTFPLIPELCCGSRDGINTVDPVSPSTPRDGLPEYSYPQSRNASFSSMGPGFMYPNPTQVEPRSRQFDGYAKPTQDPLPRFPGTLPAPHGVPMHARHYHRQHYAASQGHMVPQTPAFPPPPATDAVTVTITASGSKRYHCRYASATGCEKTFTTSAHASRHSKIHTHEKGIQCAFANCPKKFTRADNMKQHLETHFKDSRRPRPSSSGAGSRSRHALRKNASASAVAMRRGGRGLTCDMVRLRPRQIREVNIKEGNEALV